MPSDFAHLGLRRWPFTVVPRPGDCDFLADRKQLKTDLDSMLRFLARRDTSSIHIIWAWFGAGKTHTLYYIKNTTSNIVDEYGRSNGLIPLYTELPRSPQGFLDVYRSFATALDFEVLTDAYLEARTGPSATDVDQQLRQDSLDLANALSVLATGDQSTRAIAQRWLRGEKFPIARFREAGLSRAISSPEDALKVFPHIIQILGRGRLASGAGIGRVIWLVDEFQRIAATPKKVLDDINSGLHAAFNACPTGLTLVLSFSGNPEQELPDWFSRELRDRIGVTKVMVLPPLNRASALEFVADVLAHHRTRDNKHGAFFPFTQGACEKIVDWIGDRDALKPRLIMQAFSDVLEEADVLIEERQMTQISADFASEVLKERTSLSAGYT